MRMLKAANLFIGIGKESTVSTLNEYPLHEVLYSKVL